VQVAVEAPSLAVFLALIAAIKTTMMMVGRVDGNSSEEEEEQQQTGAVGIAVQEQASNWLTLLQQQSAFEQKQETKI